MAPQTPGALRWTCNEWEMYSYSFPRPDTTHHTAQGSRLHVSCTLSQGVRFGHPCKEPVARKGFPRMFGENGKHARLHARSDARPRCRVDRFAGQRSRAARQRSSRRRLRSTPPARREHVDATSGAEERRLQSRSSQVQGNSYPVTPKLKTHTQRTKPKPASGQIAKQS